MSQFTESQIKLAKEMKKALDWWLNEDDQGKLNEIEKRYLADIIQTILITHEIIQDSLEHDAIMGH